MSEPNSSVFNWVVRLCICTYIWSSRLVPEPHLPKSGGLVSTVCACIYFLTIVDTTVLCLYWLRSSWHIHFNGTHSKVLDLGILYAFQCCTCICEALTSKPVEGICEVCMCTREGCFRLAADGLQQSPGYEVLPLWVWCEASAEVVM